MIVALLIFAGILLLLGVFSIRRHVSNLKRLGADVVLPSDERSYQRKQAYRRLVTSVLIIGLGGLLAGAYFSGLEQRAEELVKNRQGNGDGPKPPIPQEDQDFLRIYSIYWISVLFLLFLVLSLAIVDIIATRRYAWQQMRRIQSENRTVLERDLAMYRQQKLNDRMKRGSQ